MTEKTGMKRKAVRATIAIAVGWSLVNGLIAWGFALNPAGFRSLTGEVVYGFRVWVELFVGGWIIALLIGLLTPVIGFISDWVDGK